MVLQRLNTRMHTHACMHCTSASSQVDAARDWLSANPKAKAEVCMRAPQPRACAPLCAIKIQLLQEMEKQRKAVQADWNQYVSRAYNGAQDERRQADEL